MNKYYDFVYPSDPSKSLIHIYHDKDKTLINVVILDRLETIAETNSLWIVKDLIERLTDWYETIPKTEVPNDIIRGMK